MDRVTSESLLGTADLISRSALHAAIRMDDFSVGDAVPHLQEAITHAQTFIAQARTVLAGLEVLQKARAS